MVFLHDETDSIDVGKEFVCQDENNYKKIKKIVIQCRFYTTSKVVIIFLKKYFEWNRPFVIAENE